MSKLLLPGLTLVAGLIAFTGPASRAADGSRASDTARQDDQKVVTRVDGDLLKQFLEEEGYKGVTVDKSDDDIHLVRVKLDGLIVVIYCNLKYGDIVCRASFLETNATQQKVNQWNLSKKFFKAYLDEDGVAVLEHGLVVRHGVTVKAVKAHVAFMRPGMRAFMKEVCE